jgi:hypothetical protein
MQIYRKLETSNSQHNFTPPREFSQVAQIRSKGAYIKNQVGLSPQALVATEDNTTQNGRR